MTGARIFACAGEGNNRVSVDLTGDEGQGVVSVGPQMIAGTHEQVRALYALLHGIYGDGRA